MSDNGSGTALVQRVEDTARGVSALSGGSEAFEVAQRMAKALCSSSVVPTAYQGNIANVMVAMEYANRLGASVLSVMQNLDVIHGRPSLRATFLIGTVNASGRFTPIRFRWQGEEGTDTWGCRAVATDRESGEECIGPLVTIALAKAEGWYGKSGSKWKTIPELMLMYRAGAWWSRVYCPELSLGLHTTDEMEDMGPPPARRAEVLAAALDTPEAPAQIGGPGAAPRADDDAAPTAGQLEQLESLREKAREAGQLEFDDEASIDEAVKAEDGASVRMWASELSRRLVRAGGEQASLLSEEG